MYVTSHFPVSHIQTLRKAYLYSELVCYHYFSPGLTTTLFARQWISLPVSHTVEHIWGCTPLICQQRRGLRPGCYPVAPPLGHDLLQIQIAVSIFGLQG